MYDILLRGGPLVVPIAICALLALTVFLERLWVLRRTRVIPDAFVNRIHEMINERRISDALLLCEENKNPMANIMEAALRNADKERSDIKEMVEEVGKHEGAQLEQYIEVIGTCAAISPLMGLLGTVTGMMDVFQQVEQVGLGDPSAFASGIWQALITTAIGLSVAIPAFIFYKYLLGKVDGLLIEMEEKSLRLIDLVANDP